MNQQQELAAFLKLKDKLSKGTIQLSKFPVVKKQPSGIDNSTQLSLKSNQRDLSPVQSPEITRKFLN